MQAPHHSLDTDGAVQHLEQTINYPLTHHAPR